MIVAYSRSRSYAMWWRVPPVRSRNWCVNFGRAVSDAPASAHTPTVPACRILETARAGPRHAWTESVAAMRTCWIVSTAAQRPMSGPCWHKTARCFPRSDATWKTAMSASRASNRCRRGAWSTPATTLTVSRNVTNLERLLKQLPKSWQRLRGRKRRVASPARH